MIFGLPVLCALLVARHCKSIAEAVRLSLIWGGLPVGSLLGWATLTWVSSPETPWTLWKIFMGRGDVHILLRSNFYVFTIACAFVIGIGLVGSLAFIAMARRGSSPMDPIIKWSILAANIIYLALVVQKIMEPQYFLPTLAWMSLACGFGVGPLLSWCRQSRMRNGFLAAAVSLHVIVVAAATYELKSPRVHDLDDIKRAGVMIPPESRVIVAYPFYGGSAAVWLDHSVTVVHDLGELQTRWPQLQRMGFTHLVSFHVDHRYDFTAPLKAVVTGLHRVTGGSVKAEKSEPFDNAAADIRRYCDRTFTKLFESNDTALYLLPAERTAITAK
jgi:hypothetical protein